MCYHWEVLALQSTESVSLGPHQHGQCSLHAALCQRMMYTRTATWVKCHPGPHTTPGRSTNLVTHSGQQISISTHFFLTSLFSACLLLCVVFYMWMGEHTKAQECPKWRWWWLLTIPVSTSDLGGWEDSPSTTLVPSFACSLPPLLLHLGHNDSASAMATPALQPGRLKVSIRCHTSLPASMLLFSFLFVEASPQNSVPTTATLTMPAGDAVPPYLSPRFEFLQNIPITHQLFRLSHKQQPQQKDQGL